VAPARFDDLAADRESDARVLDLLAVGALEHRADLVAESGRNSDAVVLHAEQPQRVAALGPGRDPRGLIGVELQTVGHEILKDASELGAVAADHRKRRYLEPPVKLFDSVRERCGDVGHELASVDRVRGEAHAGPGILEHAVDQAASARMGLPDALEQSLVLRGPAALELASEQLD
jgi:hypothetical protein